MGSLNLLQKNSITLYAEPSKLALGLIPFGPLLTHNAHSGFKVQGTCQARFCPQVSCTSCFWFLECSSQVSVWLASCCLALSVGITFRKGFSDYTASTTLQYFNSPHSNSLDAYLLFTPLLLCYEKCDLEHSDSNTTYLGKHCIPSA